MFTYVLVVSVQTMSTVLCWFLQNTPFALLATHLNKSCMHSHLCPTAFQRVMSKWAHFHVWAIGLTHLSYWFITACNVGREAGSNACTCCDILVPFFGILDKGVWRRASLTLVSLLLYNMHVSCSNLQQTEPWNNSVSLRCAKASRCSAGNVPPLLSGWGLSYNHSQCTHGWLQELDIPKILMGAALVINNLWAILNNTTANIDIPLFCGPILFAGWLISMHLELFLPLALSFMTTSQRWWAWWRNTRKISASPTCTRTSDVLCDDLAARFTNTS